MKKWLALLIACFLFIGADYHVDPDGDNGGDGSEGDPWQTIDYAMDQLSSGDRLLVHAGTYEETVTLTTSHNNETIEAAGDGTAKIWGQILVAGTDSLTIKGLKFDAWDSVDEEYVFDCTTYWGNDATSFIRGNYGGATEDLTVDGCTFELTHFDPDSEAPYHPTNNPGGDCPWVGGVEFSLTENHSNMNVKNCIFKNMTGQSCSVGRSDGAIIQDNIFGEENGNLSWCDAIRVFGEDWVVKDNCVTGLYNPSSKGWTETASWYDHPDCIQIWGMSDFDTLNGTIERNFFVDCIAQAFHIQEKTVGYVVQYITIQNNIWAGITSFGYIFCDDVYFYNNTFFEVSYNHLNRAVFFGNTTQGKAENCRMYNNTFCKCGTSGEGFYYLDSGVTISADYNHAADDSWGSCTGFSETNGVDGGDPVFSDDDWASDPYGCDFHILNASVLKDVGTATYAPSNDFWCGARPGGFVNPKIDDIGADEYQNAESKYDPPF